ncbi:MAG: hypothetical protein SNJ63_05300 [Sphingomonadaceae bacterium]
MGFLVPDPVDRIRFEATADRLTALALAELEEPDAVACLALSAARVLSRTFGVDDARDLMVPILEAAVRDATGEGHLRH